MTWRIHKDTFRHGLPSSQRWLHPWIVSGPPPVALGKTYMLGDVNAIMALLWHARGFGGCEPLFTGEVARFPTYRAACTAFATASDLQCPMCERLTVTETETGWKCRACGSYDTAVNA